ncbi:MAG: 3'-5' exonuclease [Acidimicrobiaceae bacterium]|nr:3'-5' exonuclease [Acidimicrobiaceae bacterium]MYJ40931.1 3'-5' exonuclease [Acidimicrobiaceae bacterium]
MARPAQDPTLVGSHPEPTTLSAVAALPSCYFHRLVARLPEYVVFDLETNADRPQPSEHEIIQIGAVLVSGGDIIDDFNTLVRPQRRLPERITELTGIEFGQLAHAPSLEHALGKFFRWVDGRPMVAHNGFGYDYLVLDAAAKSLGLAVPTGLRLDTLELAHVVCPRAGAHMVRGVDGHRPPPGRSLDQLASRFGIDSRDKHDALNDARMTQQVMRSLLDQLNERTPARCLHRGVRAGDRPCRPGGTRRDRPAHRQRRVAHHGPRLPHPRVLRAVLGTGHRHSPAGLVRLGRRPQLHRPRPARRTGRHRGRRARRVARSRPALSGTSGGGAKAPGLRIAGSAFFRGCNRAASGRTPVP